MTEKVVGYLLLVLGLVIMGYSAVSVYNVFTGSWEPVNIFSFSGISINTVDLIGGDLSPAQRQELNSQMGNAQMEVISRDLLNDPLNLAAHLFLMGFVVSVGFKIGSLGTQLIRPIKVTVRELNQNGQKTT